MFKTLKNSYRYNRVQLTFFSAAPKHDAHLGSIKLLVPFCHRASKSPSFTRQTNKAKTLNTKSPESITPGFLSLFLNPLNSSEHRILPPVTSFSGQKHFSITFVLILHQHPRTGSCKKKNQDTPSSIHFHSGSPSFVPSKRKKNEKINHQSLDSAKSGVFT